MNKKLSPFIVFAAILILMASSVLPAQAEEGYVHIPWHTFQDITGVTIVAYPELSRPNSFEFIYKPGSPREGVSGYEILIDDWAAEESWQPFGVGTVDVSDICQGQLDARATVLIDGVTHKVATGSTWDRGPCTPPDVGVLELDGECFIDGGKFARFEALVSVIALDHYEYQVSPEGLEIEHSGNTFVVPFDNNRQVTLTVTAHFIDATTAVQTVMVKASDCGKVDNDNEENEQRDPGTQQQTFFCDVENVWNLPEDFVTDQFGYLILEVKDNALLFGPINMEGGWKNGQILEFQYVDKFGVPRLGHFTLTITVGADGFWSGIECLAQQDPEAKTSGDGCIGCPPPVCLLQEGMFIWNAASQRYQGIKEAEPIWFNTFEDAIASGLTWAGSECSACGDVWSVRLQGVKYEVWFGPNFTVEDTAAAIRGFFGVNSPYGELEGSTIAAQDIQAQWVKDNYNPNGGWYVLDVE